MLSWGLSTEIWNSISSLSVVMSLDLRKCGKTGIILLINHASHAIFSHHTKMECDLIHILILQHTFMIKCLFTKGAKLCFNLEFRIFISFHWIQHTYQITTLRWYMKSLPLLSTFWIPALLGGVNLIMVLIMAMMMIMVIMMTMTYWPSNFSTYWSSTGFLTCVLLVKW